MRGGGGGLSFFLEDKTSVPDVFSGCSLIPRAHFETSVVIVAMVTRYDVTSSRWSSQFWMKIHVFSTSFKNKVNLVAKIIQRAYLCVIFHVKQKKNTISRGFNLISNSW